MLITINFLKKLRNLLRRPSEGWDPDLLQFVILNLFQDLGFKKKKERAGSQPSDYAKATTDKSLGLPAIAQRASAGRPTVYSDLNHNLENFNNNQKAVLYIITKLELGGAQKVCLALLDQAAKAHFPAGLVSGSQGVLVEQAKRYQNVYLIDSMTREVSIKSIIQEIKNFYKLIKHIRSFKRKYPDLIVHTHSTKAGILGRWAALCSGVKYRVHTVHGFGFNRYQSYPKWLLIWFVEWFTSLITTKFVCVSEHDQVEGARRLPRFAHKNVLIRAAVSVKSDVDVNSSRANNLFIIGTISCFKPQKNLLDLFKAFKQACGFVQQDMQLQVIGDGIMRSELEAWIDAHDMRDKIILLGWRNDVTPFLQQWDLFAMSSLWEGLPCAIIEARLHKLPVVAYNIDGIPEVVFDGVNGYLVPAGNWQLLADRIVKLVLDHSCYQVMSKYQDNLADFTYQVMFQKHYELYKAF